MSNLSTLRLALVLAAIYMASAWGIAFFIENAYALRMQWDVVVVCLICVGCWVVIFTSLCVRCFEKSVPATFVLATMFALLLPILGVLSGLLMYSVFVVLTSGQVAGGIAYLPIAVLMLVFSLDYSGLWLTFPVSVLFTWAAFFAARWLRGNANPADP